MLQIIYHPPNMHDYADYDRQVDKNYSLNNDYILILGINAEISFNNSKIFLHNLRISFDVDRDNFLRLFPKYISLYEMVSLKI